MNAEEKTAVEVDEKKPERVDEKKADIPEKEKKTKQKREEKAKTVIDEDPVEEKPKKEISLQSASETGKKKLFDLESKIAYLYEGYFANRGFAYTAKQVVINLEEYLQALLLTAATDGRELKEEEMRFIWSVLSHADIFAGMNSIEETLERAKKIIETVPYAILISVAVDKFYDKKESAEICNAIYDLYLLMCLLSGISAIKKEKLLAKIREFAQAQGVKL